MKHKALQKRKYIQLVQLTEEERANVSAAFAKKVGKQSLRITKHYRSIINWWNACSNRQPHLRQQSIARS